MYQGIIRSFKIFILSLITLSYIHAQSAFIPSNDDYYHLIDRLEIKRGKFTEGFHFNVKPFERKAIVALTDSILKEGTINLTDRDWETIDYLREDSWEWTNGMISTDSAQYNRLARLGWFKAPPPGKKRRFFDHPADLYSIHNKDFDLHFNFVTTNFIGKDNSYDTTRFNNLWFTGRGVEIRGMINNKFGFYTYVADNQGHFPRYVNDFSTPNGTSANFPGEGLTKYTPRNRAVDYLSARGYVTFRPLRSVNIRFGHDYNVFGNGYRSLILSDNSSPYLFLRIDTQLGRFHYTNLWTSMINTGKDSFIEHLRRKKFAAIHHLSVNLTEKINIGVFEAEVFNRDSVGGGYDLNYLNPIIFYRYVESYIGSQDNALLGFDFRWLLGKKASIYSQFVLDEFLTRFLFNGSGSWTNKYSLQVGAKYVDAFGIPNLDLQAEYNMVRPYTYSHKDGGRNYQHYGQSLAHPLGANFREYLGIIRYKVSSRLTAYGTVMMAEQGKDPTTGPYMNFGGDISKSYEERSVNRDGELNQKIGQGIKASTLFTDLRLSYSLAHNLFLDGRYQIRKITSQDVNVATNSNVFTFAIRYNMAYRQQTF
ncbi:capsule assembly Wzi family protein [Dyadobacter sp. CY323]|uniref:capsule assembly Wzi family protein n=1 Tax=Dyadobacter sp. CY323 TaxID=2907302 RepID=UPI001F3FFA9F|nr:capsule assembly Wzi family protein [Dyadobacter sp. CY323]MCE6989165.1 capsule assembly Wzi family protein [Dyadobacter sp. CY323]